MSSALWLVTVSAGVALYVLACFVGPDGPAEAAQLHHDQAMPRRHAMGERPWELGKPSEPGGSAAPRVFEERDVHAASCLSSSVINAAPKECSAVLSPGWVGIGRNLAIGSVVCSRAISERSQMNAWAHFLYFELRDQKLERMRRRTEDRRLTCTSDSFLLCRAMRGPR